MGGAESQPFVARWEFKSGYVNKQLPEVLGVWMTEDDLHHPQTYPIRLADYLTRRMNVAGMLERFAAENGLLPQFRSSREA